MHVCMYWCTCLCFLGRGVCTQAPCYCIIMEYCAHGQLYEVLRAGRKITPRLLVDWSTGIASGMNYLHLHKIIHRDLKSPKWVLELMFQLFCSFEIQNIYQPQLTFSDIILLVQFQSGQWVILFVHLLGYCWPTCLPVWQISPGTWNHFSLLLLLNHTTVKQNSLLSEVFTFYHLR